jgi:hypothetical protein
VFLPMAFNLQQQRAHRAQEGVMRVRIQRVVIRVVKYGIELVASPAQCR